LVRRDRSTADRRVVHISLSDKGQKLAKQIQVEPMEIFRGALLSLSHADLRDLLRIMNKLQRYVRTHIADGAMDTAPPEDT
jgi:DNA-binding MarR family transcriptional regulator